MEYQKLRKAYIVGTKEDVRQYGMPWSAADIVMVGCKDGPSKARWIYAKKEYYDFVDVIARRNPDDDTYLFEGEERYMSQIEQIIGLRKWRNDMQEMVNSHPGAKVHIYSGQWGAWWRSNGCGYTDAIELAGIYSIEDAWKRVSHCGLEKRISFHLLNSHPAVQECDAYAAEKSTKS
jgi:hypothetical protein